MSTKTVAPKAHGGRRATGTLIKPGADGIWRGRVTRPDGSRPFYSLGTADKSHARRVLAKLAAAIAAGDEVPNAVADAEKRDLGVVPFRSGARSGETAWHDR